MKDINKIKDYRLKYKSHYDIDFDSDYAIHHIDFNRKNNDIDNLLLLPRGLHNKYHMLLNGCANSNHMISGIIGELSTYQIKAMINLATTLKEIQKWEKWKEHNYDDYIKSYIFDGTEEYGIGGYNE